MLITENYQRVWLGILLFPWLFFSACNSFGNHFSQISSLKLIDILFILLVQPVIEEIIFRGYLQKWCIQYSRRAIHSIILVNLAFLILYWGQGYRGIHLAAVFPAGIALSWLQLTSGKLGSVVVLHGYFNVVMLICLALA